MRRRARRIWFWWKARHQRCDLCARRKHLNDAWSTFGNRDGKVWHGECIALVQSRRVAQERLEVLDLVTDVIGLDARDVTMLAEWRHQSGEPYRTAEEAEQSNKAWRVMRDVERHREDPS